MPHVFPRAFGATARVLLSALGALALAAPAAPAQVSNAVQLLANVNPGAGYAGCCGYRSPSGIEIAIVGDQNGTWFINATNPTQPSVVGFVPGAGSIWREIQTYSTFAYIVTEAAGGMQIVDLSNPLQPVLVRTWGTSIWGNAHSIAIDQGAGKCYVCGTNVGIAVVDLVANPSNPTLIRTWNDVYIHDLWIQHGLAHMAAIWAGEYWIVDVSSLPTMTVLSRSRTPGAFTHNTGVTADDRIAITTDESAGGHVAIWDIADPRNPVKISEYTANPAAIGHNAYVLGNFVHVAYYTEGYRLLDITDPARPFEAGFYDTWPGASGGYNGNWGCYPYQPSGVVYVSDRSTGLYILRPDPISATHTPLTDTTNEDTPRQLSVRASSASGLAPQSATLRWRVGGGSWQNAAMTPGSLVGEFVGAIPAISAPAEVEYGFVFQFAASTAAWPGDGSTGFQYRIGQVRSLYLESFEGGWNGWTHGASFGQDDWEIGVPQGKNGDPSFAHSPTQCAGTDLGFGANDGRYSTNSTSFLQSPVVNVGTRTDLKLRIRRWLAVEDASRDQARILVNGLPIYTNSTTSSIQDSAWLDLSYPLNTVLGGAPSAVFRFELQTDGAGNRAGWNLDDVEVFFLSDCMPPIAYGQGVAGSGAFTPALAQVGDPSLGNAGFALRASSLVGGAPSVLMIGFAPNSLSVLGVTLLVDPSAAITLATTAQGPIGQAGVGTAQWATPVPPNGLLDGATVYTQVLTVDAGGPQGVASSSGLRVRVCADR
ncbi:MAG: choice-of-anchor B family protein [Planctomycetes bacterium]|nr:choice-of-anchor B family protein [Planctomycetota bacterium]